MGSLSAAAYDLRRPRLVGTKLASFDVAGVLLNVGVPFLGKVIQREYRRNRANWYAGAAVDALDRVNEKLINLFEPGAAVFVLRVLFRMDAVHRAGIHTGRILSPDAGFCNYIRHSAILLIHRQSTDVNPHLYCVGRGPSSSICRSQIPPSRV